MSQASKPVWDTYPFSIVAGKLVVGHPGTNESAVITLDGVSFADGRSFPWAVIMAVNLVLSSRGSRGWGSARLQSIVGLLSGIVMVAGSRDDGRDHFACVTLSKEPAPWFVMPARPKLTRQHRRYAERFGDDLNDRVNRHRVLSDPVAAVEALRRQINPDPK